MHPILASGQRLALYLGFWFLIAILLAAVYSTVTGVQGIEALILVTPLSIAYSFVCLSAWYVCRATPLKITGTTQIFVTHIGSAGVSAAIWVVAWEIWVQTLAGFPAFDQSVADYRSQLPLIFATGMVLFWLASMLHYLLIAFETSREAETRELGLEVLAREAELKALRAQIDPHFLFNSLHSISALTATDPGGARRMCLLLADFFRSSVRLGAEDTILLEQEIEMVHQYLDIEKVRCGERLLTQIDVASACRSCRIPPLILQPLVENSVRHGIQSLVDGGTVTIAAAVSRGELTLTVENPFDSDAPRSSRPGLGLANVKRRLKTLFGSAGETRIVKADGLFRVSLRLPC